MGHKLFSMSAKDGRWNLEVNYWDLAGWLFLIGSVVLFIYQLVILGTSGIGIFTGFWSILWKVLPIVGILFGCCSLFFKNKVTRRNDNIGVLVTIGVLILVFFIDTTAVCGKFAEVGETRVVDDNTTTLYVNSFSNEVVRFPDQVEIELEARNETWEFSFDICGSGSDLYRKHSCEDSLVASISRNLDLTLKATDTSISHEANADLFFRTFMGHLETGCYVSLCEVRRN